MSVVWTRREDEGRRRAQMGKQQEECTVRFDEGLYVLRIGPARVVAKNVVESSPGMFRSFDEQA